MSSRGLAVLCFLPFLTSCGPSMRTLVESDMRFEHCYRIDDDPTAAMPKKRACWHDWVNRYTRGQDKNRVDYARERLRVLELSPTAGAPAQPTTTIASPQPAVNPYAPPPATISAPAATQALEQ